jgi:hypothetical protein
LVAANKDYSLLIRLNGEPWKQGFDNILDKLDGSEDGVVVRIVEVDGGASHQARLVYKKNLLMLSGQLVHKFVVNRHRCQYTLRSSKGFQGEMQSIAYAMTGQVVRYRRCIPSMLTKKLDKMV